MKHLFRLTLGLTVLSFMNLFGNLDYFPKDDPALSEYLENMPWQHYKLYNVPGLGKFWVDNAKDCVKDTIKNGDIWERYIISKIKKYTKPGDKVIDIGAHMGTITLAMSNIVGPKGMVYAFEGERQFFRELCNNIKVNNKTNIKPHLAWISDEDKLIDVTWFYGPDYSPVHSDDEGFYQLNTCRLDSFEFKNISLIKCDVECMEDQVLDGAYGTIMDSRPTIIIEIMGGFGHDNSPRVQNRIKQTIAKLNSLNYSVSKIWVDDYLAIPNERLKK